MKLGQVLEKERTRKRLSLEQAAVGVGLTPNDYRVIEAGDSEIENWGFLLAAIAIALSTPTSRLIADSGKAADAKAGHAGSLIKARRENRGKTTLQMCEQLHLTNEEYEAIENGQSPIETWGAVLLRFAEMIEQPVFNLFYPCGVPAGDLSDYP